MENEIATKSTEVKSFQTLPEAYRDKKAKGKPYAFYSYKHYEVYPGDVFYSIYQGKIIFARAITKGRFEPFGLLDILDGRQKLPYDDVIDLTSKALPSAMKNSKAQEKFDEASWIDSFKQQMLPRFATALMERSASDYIAEINERSFERKIIEIKLGVFRQGSVKGKRFVLPGEIQNKTYVVMNGLEKEFMEPYFEIKATSAYHGENEKTPALMGDEKIIFRKIYSLKDFYNLLDEGKPELMLCADSIRARVSHPYHYIPKEWVNGVYECSRGTKYDINTTFWFFAEQFVHNIGMSIVNMKQQMMPYYQKYHNYEIPKDLRREDVQYLASIWFVQDVRDGLYYFLQPAIINDDGSYFCLDKKWFSLLHDRVRRYGKKKVCDIDEFKFRSSKDKRYFQLFSLEQEDLAYAFETAIDIPNFEDFYEQMNRHFNPALKKSGALENNNPVRLTEEQKKRIIKAIAGYLESHEKEGRQHD